MFVPSTRKLLGVVVNISGCCWWGESVHGGYFSWPRMRLRR
jgi:hypothetical protein